jgi:hypothetical protein
MTTLPRGMMSPHGFQTRHLSLGDEKMIPETASSGCEGIEDGGKRFDFIRIVWIRDAEQG